MKKRQCHNLLTFQLEHHGSRTSSSETFLRVINPKDVFISTGLKNNHQFPGWEVLQLLKKLKLNFYSTANKVNWQYNIGVGKFIFFVKKFECIVINREKK